MSRREDRERKATQWLEHLQSYKESGGSLAAYARSHGLALWALYHWRKVLQHEGRWCDKPVGHDGSSSATKVPRRIPLRFARVSLSDPIRSAPLKVRIQLRNGRHAEVELSARDELAEILTVLEQLA